MKHGVHAETALDRLQNKLRGVGSLMRREGFPLKVRLRVARTVYAMLGDKEFVTIQRNLVFGSFFTRGELDDPTTTMPEFVRGE